jgi:hypothetical protein
MHQGMVNEQKVAKHMSICESLHVHERATHSFINTNETAFYQLAQVNKKHKTLETAKRGGLYLVR